MPVGWPFGLGGCVDEAPETDRIPGVNRGRKRGVTKSPKPRRKR